MPVEAAGYVRGIADGGGHASNHGGEGGEACRGVRLAGVMTYEEVRRSGAEEEFNEERRVRVGALRHAIHQAECVGRHTLA